MKKNKFSSALDNELLSSNDKQFYKIDEIKEDEVKVSEEKIVEATHITEKTGHFLYYFFAVISAIVLVAVMLYCITFLPRFGASEGNITLNDIEQEYIENGIEKTGATNFVTGMILDYRAFDTLGESFVLFTAVNIVLVLLQGFKDSKSKKGEIKYKPVHDPILRDGCTLLVPAILLFGAYVILNGSISPGGGFSGGAIMGAGLIIYAISFGFDHSGRFFKDKTFKIISSISLLTYCASKTYSFLTGAMEVESIVPLGIPGTILSGGIIFILNVCVGLVVTCTMFGFYSLYRKGEI